MQKASDLVSSGMLSVIGRPQANYKYACVQAREHCLSPRYPRVCVCHCQLPFSRWQSNSWPQRGEIHHLESMQRALLMRNILGVLL